MMGDCGIVGCWPGEVMLSLHKTLVPPKCRDRADKVVLLQDTHNIRKISVEMWVLLHIILLNNISFCLLFLFHQSVQISLPFDHKSWRRNSSWLFSFFNLDPDRDGPNFQNVF